MLVRYLVAVCLFGSFAAASIWAAPASPKHGDVPLSQCAVVFERFSHIRLPADTKAVSRALGDNRWINLAVIYQQTILAGWIPIRHSLGPPGGVYVIDLSAPVSSHIAATGSIFIRLVYSPEALRPAFGHLLAVAPRQTSELMSMRCVIQTAISCLSI